jgi:hypothetical protein
VISYSSNPPTWGGKVRSVPGREDLRKVAYFKLGLQEDIAEYYFHRSAKKVSSVLGFADNHKWRHPEFPHAKALDFTTDFFVCIHDFVTNDHLPLKYGSNFLGDHQISWVITVPAIWTPSANSLTRSAAVKAGISGASLSLVTEPEAAALYCATRSQEVDLCENDKFLVCDAGGGTVVNITCLPVLISAGSHLI